MVRSIFLPRSRLAAQSVTHGSRRDYIPEVRFPRGFDDETVSSRGLDGTALCVFFAQIYFFHTRASSLDGFFCLVGKFDPNLEVKFLKMLVPWNFEFQQFWGQQSLEIIQNCLLIVILNGPEHPLASQPFGSVKGDPGVSPGLYSGRSVPQGGQ